MMLEYLYIIGFFVFILFLIFLIYISRKKYILEIFPNKNVDSFRRNLIQIFLNKKWNVEVKEESIHIESGYFSAVNLHFKQNGQNFEVYYVSSATVLAWVLMFVGVFVLGFMSIIVAFVTFYNSRRFAKDTMYPLLIKIKDSGFKGITYKDLLIDSNPLK